MMANRTAAPYKIVERQNFYAILAVLPKNAKRFEQGLLAQLVEQRTLNP
jgi:hypothetical protein